MQHSMCFKRTLTLGNREVLQDILTFLDLPPFDEWDLEYKYKDWLITPKLGINETMPEDKLSPIAKLCLHSYFKQQNKEFERKVGIKFKW